MSSKVKANVQAKSCPHCGREILVEQKDNGQESQFAHANPPCDEWVEEMHALGKGFVGNIDAIIDGEKTALFPLSN